MEAEDIKKRLDEIEDLAIGMDEVTLTIPWRTAKALLSKAGPLTNWDRVHMEWNMGECSPEKKSLRESKKRKLLMKTVDNSGDSLDTIK